MRDDTIALPAVDAESPWLGLASFTEETRGFFHGREDDVAELARRVQRRVLTVLFGQSGHGKTSLLRAGLVPRLQPEGYCPVYLRLDHAPEAPAAAEQIKAAILRATRRAGTWTRSGSSVAGETLWEFLHHREDVLQDRAGRPLVPLLIIDQFEEIFTLAQVDSPGRARAQVFLGELGDLVENRPPRALEERIERDEADAARFDFARADYRVLISLREDYLAHLEGLKGAMPSVTQNRVRLARFDGAHALAAVRDPAPHLVPPEVANQIVRFIAGGTELAQAEVEPALLSLVCRELNNARLAGGQPAITADLLAGSRDTILQEFYERTLADQAPGVRRFIEDELLTDSGYRESVTEERVQKAFAAAGAGPGSLGTLVRRRLLRIEERLDLRRVELTHDVLTTVVGASRALRREREAREAVQKQLADTRAKEAGTQRALWRARIVALCCGLLAAGAVGSAVFGYFSLRRARAAEAEAEKSVRIAREAASQMEATNELAEQARTDAEKIVSYLLDDFYNELEPIGRLDVICNLARKAVDYYHTLPITLRTPTTVRNQALALTRLGAVVTLQGQAADGGSLLDEAIRLFEHLRDNGDQSDDLAVGMAVAYRNRARAYSSLQQPGEAYASARLGSELLRPRAAAPDASPTVVLEYAEALNRWGYQQLRNFEYRAAAATYEEERRVLDRLGGVNSNNPRVAGAYVDTGEWLTEASARSGDLEETFAVGRESIALADKVLEADPGNRRALRAQGITYTMLAESYAGSLQLAQSDAAAAGGLRVQKKLLQLDPTNSINLFNNENTVRQLSWNAIQRGEVSTGLQGMADQNERLLRQFPERMTANYSFLSADAAIMAATVGDLSRAKQFIEVGSRMLEQGRKAATGELDMYTLTYSEWVEDARSALAAAEGDHAASRALSAASVARVAKLNPVANGDRFVCGFAMRAAQRRLANAALRLHRFTEAETAARAAEAVWLEQPAALPVEQSDQADNLVTLGLALVLQQRTAEAQAVIAPALATQRRIAALGPSPWQQLALATALYASAVAQPADHSAARTAALAEARQLLAGLAPECMRSVPARELTRWVEAAQNGGPAVP